MEWKKIPMHNAVQDSPVIPNSLNSLPPCTGLHGIEERDDRLREVTAHDVHPPVEVEHLTQALGQVLHRRRVVVQGGIDPLLPEARIPLFQDLRCLRNRADDAEEFAVGGRAGLGHEASMP